MKKLVIIGLCVFMSIALFMGCEDEPTKVEAPETATALYVLNSGGQSISVVDLETDSVYNNVATVGTWPNQLVYKDDKLYCVNSGSNNIMIFNVDDFTATPGVIDLGTGHNPQSMVFADNDIAYVTCSVSNKVLKVNVTSKTVLAEIDAGIGTTGIAEAEGKIYASNTAFDAATWGYGPGTVTVINTADDAVVTTIDVAKNPFSVGVAPDGKVHVVCTGNYWSEWGKVMVVDPATDTVVDSVITLGSPGSIGISESDNLAFLTVWGMGCLVYNTQTYAMVNDTSNYFLGKGGTGVAVDVEGDVFVSVWDDDQVIKLDKDGVVLATYDVGDSPAALALKVE